MLSTYLMPATFLRSTQVLPRLHSIHHHCFGIAEAIEYRGVLPLERPVTAEQATHSSRPLLLPFHNSACTHGGCADDRTRAESSFPLDAGSAPATIPLAIPLHRSAAAVAAASTHTRRSILRGHAQSSLQRSDRMAERSSLCRT